MSPWKVCSNGTKWLVKSCYCQVLGEGKHIIVLRLTGHAGAQWETRARRLGTGRKNICILQETLGGRFGSAQDQSLSVWNCVYEKKTKKKALSPSPTERQVPSFTCPFKFLFGIKQSKGSVSAIYRWERWVSQLFSLELCPKCCLHHQETFLGIPSENQEISHYVHSGW